MKVFETNEKWAEKVNFVDENNVFVGYDMGRECCEHADWFISDEIANKLPKDLNQPTNLDGYFFDKDFFESIEELKEDRYDYNVLDCGGCVVFRLTNGKDAKYLHLFNCHNGYYGHGFEMKIQDKIKKNGRI